MERKNCWVLVREGDGAPGVEDCFWPIRDDGDGDAGGRPKFGGVIRNVIR